jgi:hypothetical protein
MHLLTAVACCRNSPHSASSLSPKDALLANFFFFFAGGITGTSTCTGGSTGIGIDIGTGTETGTGSDSAMLSIMGCVSDEGGRKGTMTWLRGEKLAGRERLLRGRAGITKLGSGGVTERGDSDAREKLLLDEKDEEDETDDEAVLPPL